MKFTLALVLLLTVQAVISQTPVNQLCDDTICAAISFCRVLRRPNANRPISPNCVECVPQGVDDVCRANDASSGAVLVGRPSRIDNLSPHFCHLGNVANKEECPAGSSCIPDPENEGLGVCCYTTRTPVIGHNCNSTSPGLGRCTEPCGCGESCITLLDEHARAVSSSCECTATQ